MCSSNSVRNLKSQHQGRLSSKVFHDALTQRSSVALYIRSYFQMSGEVFDRNWDFFDTGLKRQQ